MTARAAFVVIRYTDNGAEYVAKCYGSPTPYAVKEWTTERNAARRFGYGVARSVATLNAGKLVQLPRP